MDGEIINELHLEDLFSKITIGLIDTTSQDGHESWGGLFEETRRGLVWVTDDDVKGHCVYVYDTSGVNKNKLLEIEQNSGTILLLWHIDGAMFKKRSKGDCALIQNRFLHLVEFKANVVTSSEESIEEHYEKAAEQLINSYNLINDLYKRINIESKDIFDSVDAMIVFNPTIPRRNPTQQSFQEKFRQEHKMILYMGNKRKF